MIDLNNYADVFTDKQLDIVQGNLKAYLCNYGYLKIEKADIGKGYYVYTDKESAEHRCWTQYCYNIDYLNGWLYGAVQAVNRVMKPLPELDFSN